MTTTTKLAAGRKMMMGERFLNISNHELTQVQIEELKSYGVQEIIELPNCFKTDWSQLTPDNYRQICEELKIFMKENDIWDAHLAGFPAAVNYLCLKPVRGQSFYFAFSERQSKEETLPDGSVKKTNVFVHKGFFPYEQNWD